MAHLYKSQQTATTCGCRLHRAEFSQLVDVFKLARMKEKISVRDWRDFQANHPEMARLVTLDVATDESAQETDRTHIGKRLKKSKEKAVTATLTKIGKTKAKKPKSKKPKKPPLLARTRTFPDVRDYADPRDRERILKSWDQNRFTPAPQGPSLLDSFNDTAGRHPALASLQVSLYDYDPRYREWAWMMSQRRP